MCIRDRTNTAHLYHDLIVYPIGDVSSAIAAGLKAPGLAIHKESIALPAPAQSVVTNLAPGQTATASIALTPGVYVMACFMIAATGPHGQQFVHRDAGMRIVFWVK